MFMIAFLREPKKPRELKMVRRFRHFLASTLLTPETDASEHSTPTPLWRFGLYALWVVAVAVWAVVHWVQNL
jgi:hypothetical protein